MAWSSRSIWRMDDCRPLLIGLMTQIVLSSHSCVRASGSLPSGQSEGERISMFHRCEKLSHMEGWDDGMTKLGDAGSRPSAIISSRHRSHAAVAAITQASSLLRATAPDFHASGSGVCHRDATMLMHWPLT